MSKKYALYTNIIVICFVLGIVLICSFLTNKQEKTGVEYLNGKVTSVNSDYVMMDANGDEYQVYVNQDDLTIGDVINVKYDGNIAGSQPMRLVAMEVEVITHSEEDSDNFITTPEDNLDVPNEDNSDVIKEESDETSVKRETNVITYFNDLNNTIDTNSSFSSKIKEGFITIVDFFFYDGEISGYKFSELTDETKIKIMELAFQIDTKITDKFPNYKEYLSEKYHNFKDEMVRLYMEAGTYICENNQALCDTVTDTFDDIKKYSSIGWSYIKDLVGTGLDKLDEWYKIFSGKA